MDDKAAFIADHLPNVIAIIDDSPTNIVNYIEAGFGDKLYVRDWPYNRDGSLLRDGKRLKTGEFK